MNRLTKKSNSILKEIEYQLIDEKENLSANEGIKKIQVLGTNKLGKLEDIEEELGIDLITLFKALKKGVYVKFDSYFGNIGELDIKIVKDNATGICYRNKKWYLQEEETLVKDYGKTWALTKEELENDN